MNDNKEKINLPSDEEKPTQPTSFRIKPSLLKRFKRVCFDREIDQQDAIAQGITLWLDSGVLANAAAILKREKMPEGDSESGQYGSGTMLGYVVNALGDTLAIHGDPSRISEEERSKLDEIGTNLGEIGQSLESATQKLSELIRSFEGPGGQKGKRKGGKR